MKSSNRQQIHDRLMREGVRLMDPQATYIDDTVQIGPDTMIYPGVVLEGGTTIGAGCVIYPHCRITNSQLGEGVTVLDGSVIPCPLSVNIHNRAKSP